MELKRYEFQDVFQESSDGSLTTKRPININGVTFGLNVTFGPGVSVGGVDFHKYKYRAIAAEENNGILIIRGFYE